MNSLIYNERSWAIDLISEFNALLQKAPSPIKNAGGEFGLRGSTNTLFPDVVLFGNGARVLQGWELKMPDTPLTDLQLITNAQTKANLFHTNSYILWNGAEAALFARPTESDNFEEIKTWHDARLVNRKTMGEQKQIWKSMLKEIIQDLSFFIGSGKVRESSSSIALDESFYTSLVEILSVPDSQAIQKAALADLSLRRQIVNWAAEHSISDADMFQQLAKLNILSWINRFVFCHYLAKFNGAATSVQSIDENYTQDQVLAVFQQISSQMDFSNVFVAGLADEHISDEGWSGRLAVNQLLKTSGIDALPERALRKVLDTFASRSKKKSQGQFATPTNLAKALAWLSVKNANEPSWDPCCGSGTIAKALYDLRVELGMTEGVALSKVWASDKHQMPLQLTSISLSDPAAMNSVVQVFQKNVFDSEVGMAISLTDPTNPGKQTIHAFPLIESIASNLPYVRQEILDSAGTNRVYSRLEEEGFARAATRFGRADLYASIILDIDRLVAEGGRLALIVSNSWLANGWGDDFKSAIKSRFRIISIITSGSGRWFSNADVVATILVLEKNSGGMADTEIINFLRTMKPVGEWDNQYIQAIASCALDSMDSPEIEKHSLSWSQCEQRSDAGFLWRINFTDADWISPLSQVTTPITDFAEVARGARTGLDAFFYPGEDDVKSIDIQYLVPILKSSRESRRLVAQPKLMAFCCDATLAELKSRGHEGTLDWINRFANRINAASGLSFADHLAGQHSPWYSLSANETADFAISINPDTSLAVFRLPTKTFVNQRLTRMSATEGDHEILHALLNSISSMVGFEYLGFGRGLGALDLSSTRIQENFRILDHRLLDVQGKERIIEAFKPLLERDYLPTNLELLSSDRQHFDSVVLKEFGLGQYQKEMYAALEHGVNERAAHRQN